MKQRICTGEGEDYREGVAIWGDDIETLVIWDDSHETEQVRNEILRPLEQPLHEEER